MAYYSAWAIGLVFTLFLAEIFFTSCWFFECPPRRNFTVLDIKIPAEMFPDGVIVNGPWPLSESRGTIENSNASFHWESDKGLAVLTVLRFRTESAALAGIQDSLALDPNFSPEILNGINIRADEFYFGCGYSDFGGYRCIFLAQYEEYFVDLNSIIEPNLSIDQFEKIVHYIDELLAERLTGSQ